MKFIARERARLINFVWCFTDPKNTDWLLESACDNLLADNNLRLFLLHADSEKTAARSAAKFAIAIQPTI